MRKTKRGWELEADLRHAELIVAQLGLEHANAVSTPGIASLVAGPAEGDEDEDEEELLSPSEATAFRTIAARCMYLQPDRISSTPSRRSVG